MFLSLVESNQIVPLYFCRLCYKPRNTLDKKFKRRVRDVFGKKLRVGNVHDAHDGHNVHDYTFCVLLYFY